MKKICLALLVGVVFLPFQAFSATRDASFTMAAQVLSAARNGNTRLVQNLINSGADVNYVDSTGLSVVCTAIMNNDTRAVQILQMYGADASNCDQQIKNYRMRNNTTEETGLFSGLSPTHKLVLGVVGAGIVAAGLLWLTDAFDTDNKNSYSVGSGSHSNGSGSSSGGSSLTPAFTMPYGPRMVADNGSVNSGYDYNSELDMYSGTNFSANYTQMNQSTGGNYLLMMHGYSPFARGYLGQATLRASGLTPVPDAVFGQYNLGPTHVVSGGIPLNVALITANGVNNRTTVNSGGIETGIHDTTIIDSLQDRFLVWTTMRGGNISDVNGADIEWISSKYFNNSLHMDLNSTTSVNDVTVTENDTFDLSGNGTAIHNSSATDLDNLLAKIVGGNTSGAATGDYTGFMPNGQLTIYRTGGGTGTSGDINYYNYRALMDAANRGYYVQNPTTSAVDIISSAQIGRARIGVIANTDVIEPLHATDAKTISDFLSTATANYQTTFGNWVDEYYLNNATTPTDVNAPGYDAQLFFRGLGANYYPITVFSTGAVQTDSSWSGESKIATFENAAPLAFEQSRNLFMSVVAVNLPQGATNTSSQISGFSTTQKYSLSQWGDGNGNYYKARICGVAGTGYGSIDPWCFAAAGLTDEHATAAAAGAAGVVKSAFTYLSNQNVFALLALTADGAYLGTDPSTGKAWTDTDALVTYLDKMYELPQEYQSHISNGTMTYLDAFKQVFGYGLINLERATTPGNSIYYVTNGKIVSSSGNAYWRSASTTALHGSSVFGARSASVPVSFYDVLTSADGTLSLPRVWNMDVDISNNSAYGLYMGDTLAELKTHDVNNTMSIGDLSFGFARSERAYDDNMGGLDNLSVSYNGERFGFSSSYQHYLTDGAGRFTGLANPVLALASNAVTSGFDIRSGRFALTGRGFMGAITNEGLLENDPAISNNFQSAKLGDVVGAESGVKFSGESFSVASNVGTMRESNTILGALGTGLFEMNGADTNYVDTVLSYAFNDDIDLTLRGTYAWTHAADVANGFVNGMSDLKSNAFAAGLRFGNFDFAASMPLALVNGSMRYSFGDFSVSDDGQLIVNSLGERSLDLTPEHREYRFNASYRHSFGEWTDGALGFIYRVNPNNTNEYGNESIFMMKISHRLGI